MPATPGCSRRASFTRCSTIPTAVRCWRSCCRRNSRRSSWKSNRVLAKQDSNAPSAGEMIARTRAMIPTLRERAPQGERERRLPKATVAEMQAAGLFKVLQPKRWGGYELDILTYFETQMALGEGDMSVAWVYGVVGVHPWFVALLDDRAPKDICGKHDTTLICSSLIPTGAAKPVHGGFRISGRWKYASGCEHCTWAFL